MATPTYIREDQYIIHATVNGVKLPSTHSWQSKEGGDVTAEAVKSRPGGMLGEIALGGPGSRSDCTVKRLYTEDLHSFVPNLERACGRARMHVSWTPLDGDGNASGAGHTLTGYLKEVTVPNADANTAAASVLTLVMSADQFQGGAGS